MISVGIIRDGQPSWMVYGENGQELPKQLHTYEIGSLTKTFTAALISKAVSEGKLGHTGDLGNCWDWEADDGYLSAGALTSDIADMFAYAQMQLDGNSPFAECHESLKTISASAESYLMMGIHMDEIGMAWVIDRENGFIWHNGGTGHYNSYLGFCPETNTAAVVLSNLPPNERIPATVLGIKLLQELNR